ncbi:DUF6325 family protein [Mycobacterium aquaticum]|uniref:DUF1269 domain-containing family protein n=1 Tax=Mycobacterium aquaticum TaxID=1927124 RepID=A0A1X0BCU4_9MYCO|nr:DUF6325 family protein [Mycobacterium aquaticum]ORA40005.1 hypothetical protein BST13_01195 [Mycobacterium aquaticum]
MHEDHFGPVDYVIVEFSDSSSVAAGFDRLLDLVDHDRIRVLDLEFITKADGVVSSVPASQFGSRFAVLEGANSGLLDRDDLDTATADLTPGMTAAVLVYEELSILHVIEAWESAGATILSEGPVDVDDIDAALLGE